MSKPTLFLKGSLVSPDGDPQATAKLADIEPIDHIISWFKDRMGRTGIENRLLVLKAETASGKSTAFPAELYMRVAAAQKSNIVCTQPRRITAVRNVGDILENYPLKLGETIGWSTKFNKLRPTSISGILSATIGTLTLQLKTATDADIISKYKYILIDETHERDLQIDITLYMLKNFLLRNQDRPDCPFVVLMSATFDQHKFIKYFGVSLMNNYIHVKGKAFGYDIVWPKTNPKNYIMAAADCVESIINEHPNDDPARGDILIFMPGKGEIDATIEYLRAINSRLHKKGFKIFSPIGVDAEAQKAETEEYQKLDIPTLSQEVDVDSVLMTPSRRVIVTTNVAETGLTLPNLKYVIDSGFNRENEFNPNYGTYALLTKPAPQSRIIQRWGRSGRKFRGEVYPLYTQDIYAKLQVQQYPQILTDDISPILLDIVSQQMQKPGGEFRVEDIDMVDKPAPDALTYAIEKHYALGFISPWGRNIATSDDPDDLMQRVGDKQCWGITKLGMIALQFSMLSPENIRMILAGWSWNCSICDLITIAAYLSVEIPGKDIDWRQIYIDGAPRHLLAGAEIYHRVRLMIADDFIDGLILFNAITINVSGQGLVSRLYKWCERCGLSYDGVISFLKARDDIMNQCLSIGLDIFAQENMRLHDAKIEDLGTTVVRLKHCIYDGYKLNQLDLVGDKYMTHGSTGLTVTTPKLLRDVKDSKTSINIRPQRLLYRSLNIKLSFKGDLYKVKTDRVSVMDGYVHIDPSYIN